MVRSGGIWFGRLRAGAPTGGRSSTAASGVHVAQKNPRAAGRTGGDDRSARINATPAFEKRYRD